MDFDFLDNDLFSRPEDMKLETGAQLAAPLVHRRSNIAKRTYIAGLKREALNELIPVLPPPDTDLYIVGNGSGAEIRHGISKSFDFGSFLPHIVSMLGDKQCVGYVSTWTMNRNHSQSMLQMLKDGRLARLTVMTDQYFKRREPAICNELVVGLMASGNARYLAFKNHCKIIGVQAPNGRTCVITGSANLSAQPRAENYVLSTDPTLYAFYVRDFFEAMLANA